MTTISKRLRVPCHSYQSMFIPRPGPSKGLGTRLNHKELTCKHVEEEANIGPLENW